MKKTILTIAVLLCSTAIFADDYDVTCNFNYDFEVNGIRYYITSSSQPYTVEVAEHYDKSYSDEIHCSGFQRFINHYTGDAVIPSSVEYNGKSYSVTSICIEAFRECTGLTSISIPSSVTSIGYRAFYGCSSLTNITIPEGVTSIGQEVFDGCSSLTNISIPSSLTSIGQEVFSGCSSLTNISIPSSLTSIGISAFRGCSSLTSISIPSSLTSIGQEVFSGCSSLTSISIPSSVTSIGISAFKACTGLTSITIPESVTSIGSSAFSGCTGLKLIRCEGSTPASCGSSLFGTNGALATALLYTNCVFIVPEGSEKLYSKMEPWSNFDIVKSDAITDVETASEAILAVGTQVSEVAAASNTTEENILTRTLREIIELLQQLVETKKINLSEDGQNTLRALAALVENKTAIPTVENSFSVSVVGKTIVCSAESFQIYNLQGQNVTAQNGNLPAGVYVVVSKLGSQKVVVE